MGAAKVAETAQPLPRSTCTRFGPNAVLVLTLGAIYDPTGQRITCLPKTAGTVCIGHTDWSSAIGPIAHWQYQGRKYHQKKTVNATHIAFPNALVSAIRPVSLLRKTSSDVCSSAQY